MYTSTKTQCGGSGFSLAEVVMVSALFALIMLTLTSAIATLYRTNGHALAQAYEVFHARHGIELASRDIREMTFGDDGTYPLVSMSSTSIGFFSDIDRDNSVEYIRYVLATTTLYKYVYNATGSPITYGSSTPDETYIVSEYIQNRLQATSTFRYYMDGGVPASATSTVTDIRYIVLNVIVNIDPNRNPGEYTLRSSVAPRNLKVSL